MHTQFEDALGHEVLNIQMVLIGQMAGEFCRSLHKPERLLTVFDVRHAATAQTVIECHVRQLGDVAVQGHREGHLHILTHIGLVSEEVCVFLIRLSEYISAVEGRAEVEHAHVLLGDDGLQ